MKKYFNVKHLEYIILFLTGCLLGILCFVAVYGVKVLDVTYDAWLLNSDVDLYQHYVGWGHFRNDSWTFPFGMIRSLSEPIKMSVIYTDSIPILAVLFKLLSPLLPQTFQYFGLHGLMSFALMGGFSIILLRRFTDNRVVMVLGSFFFILSFPVLHRMYYHSALAAQWLIILSLILWLYEREEEKIVSKCVKWGIMGFLCVGIHSYFLPMVGGILLFSCIDACIGNKKNFPQRVGDGLLKIGSFCIAAILNLWILGGFSGPSSAIGGGIGTFESNLNTFINPLGKGILNFSLPLYYDFQYEGFAYIGLGLIFMLMILIVGFICNIFIKKPRLNVFAYFKEHRTALLIMLLFLLFFLISSGPIYTINSSRILAIPLPGIISKLADIFRSNGRFIWVSYYLFMLSVIVYIERIMRKIPGLIVLVLALILQVVDLSPYIAEKQAYFNIDKSYVSFWENDSLYPIIYNRKHFVLFEPSMMLMLDTGYYSSKNDMTSNCFYFARNIDETINEQREIYLSELREGKSRDDCVYVFPTQGFIAAEYPGLICYETGDYVIGVTPQTQ